MKALLALPAACFAALTLANAQSEEATAATLETRAAAVDTVEARAFSADDAKTLEIAKARYSERLAYAAKLAEEAKATGSEEYAKKAEAVRAEAKAEYSATLEQARAGSSDDAKMEEATKAAKAARAERASEAKAADTAKMEQAAKEADSKAAEAKATEAKAAEAQAAEPAKLEVRNDSKESPVQSAARPFSLDIAAPVQLAASDKASAEFQKEILPDFQKIVNENLAESNARINVAGSSLDPKNLTLKYDSNVRVYFVGEGAGYSNSLGFSTTGGGINAKDAALLFPNASSNGEKRTDGEPLVAGDFVDLGILKAGSQLDFFLIADGANGGRDVFSTKLSENLDGIQHVVSIAKDGSAFLLIGFEDLWGGGDRDYNDLVFAVEIGRANVASLAAPEPSLAVGSAFAGLAFLGFYRRRARN